MSKTIFIFGGLCVVISFLLWLERWSLFTVAYSGQLISAFAGFLLLILGILAGRYFNSKANVIKKKNQKASLSAQELRVLHLVAEGLTNKAIADRLFIGETTVKSHVSNILVKLNARRRTEAVKIGRELDII